MTTPVPSGQPKIELSSMAFLAVAFFTGVAGALQIPTLSLFLDSQIHVRPLLVGLFYTVNAVMGIIIGQWIAHWSDKSGAKRSRKKLIVACCATGVIGCVLFAFNRNYVLLLTVGVLLSSFAASAQSQLFALAREHADYTKREAVMFNSLMRAQISLAWVVGPFIAFALAVGYGFEFMYLAAAAAFCGCAILVWKALPGVPRKVHAPADPQRKEGWRDPAVKLLFLISTLMWTCNTMYLINMPLYVTRELGLSEKLAGILMGTAAGLEIPVMLLAGKLSRRFDKHLMMRFAIGAGVCFYLGLSIFSNAYVLIGLQLLNAVFIGIIASIGMIYFQDLMPRQPGTATTLFASATRCGAIMAGAIAGGIAEVWSYHGVFIVAVLLLGISLMGFQRIRKI